MSKVLSILKIPVVVILTFLIQIVISNNFELFGITPNLILVTVVIISMWNNITVSVITACIIGIAADLIFHFDLGQSFISYLVIALCISYMSKKYRKESKAAIVYITIMATCIFTGFQFVYYIIDSSLVINIFAMIKQIIIEVLLNIALSYILYKIFERSMEDKELESIYG